MHRRQFLACALAPAAVRGQSGSVEPLYLLTYDHGGLVLWGIDHFTKYLHSAVAWLERYPSFKIGLDNEAYTYDYMAQEAPQLLDEVRGLLARYRGRFGIGTCTYGQPLSQFINEESNIRQIGYALETDRRLLGAAPAIYLMSEHAMHSQIPQLLAGFGFQGAIMRTHYMMYGYNPTFDAAIGWWVGVDGSRVPAIPTYKGEGAEFGKTTVDSWMLTRYPSDQAKISPAEFRKQFAHIHPLIATRADDSGLRREELVSEIEGQPGYRWILLEQILPDFPKPQVEFKTKPDDFVVRMPWGYCGNEIWNLSRSAEVSVLTAERLAAMELLLGGANHEADLRESWKKLLVAQHHDIQICGLLKEARQFLPASLQRSGRVADASLQFIAARMQGGKLGQITVFNPSSWPRREWVEVDVEIPAGTPDVAARQGGRPAPSVTLERNAGKVRMAVLAELPALGFASFALGPQTPSQRKAELEAEGLNIRNAHWNIRLHPEGGIESIEDRRTGRSLVKRALFAGRIEGREEQSKGVWRISTSPSRAPWAVATEEGAIGGIPYRLEMTVRVDTPRIDCRATFRFAGQKIGVLSNNERDARSCFLHEEKLRFKLFPATGANAMGVRDLPFTIAETKGPYVEGNYWSAMGDGRVGVAIFNRGNMGSVLEKDGGFSVPLAHAMYYIWGTRMLDGDFSYDFALYPFTGDWKTAGLHRRALEYTYPCVARFSAAGSGSLGSELRLIEAASQDVLVSALYSEAGKIHARMHEHGGGAGQLTLRYLKGPAKFTEVDLAGRSSGQAATQLQFRPWQIRTIRIDSA